VDYIYVHQQSSGIFLNIFQHQEPFGNGLQYYENIIPLCSANRDPATTTRGREGCDSRHACGGSVGEQATRWREREGLWGSREAEEMVPLHVQPVVDRRGCEKRHNNHRYRDIKIYFRWTSQQNEPMPTAVSRWDGGIWTRSSEHCKYKIQTKCKHRMEPDFWCKKVLLTSVKREGKIRKKHNGSKCNFRKPPVM